MSILVGTLDTTSQREEENKQIDSFLLGQDEPKTGKGLAARRGLGNINVGGFSESSRRSQCKCQVGNCNVENEAANEELRIPVMESSQREIMSLSVNSP